MLTKKLHFACKIFFEKCLFEYNTRVAFEYIYGNGMISILLTKVFFFI